MIYDVGNRGPCFGQEQICDRVKPVNNGIPPLMFSSLWNTFFSSSASCNAFSANCLASKCFFQSGYEMPVSSVSGTLSKKFFGSNSPVNKGDLDLDSWKMKHVRYNVYIVQKDGCRLKVTLQTVGF